MTRRRPFITRHLCWLSLVFVGGCTALGPDYKEPELVLEARWSDTTDETIDAAAALDPYWWRAAFADPVLDELVERALQQNLSLRSAGLRVLQAQQQLAIAVGNQYPQEQSIDGQASRQEQDRTRFNNYNVGFNLTWEVDFWGRFSRQVESASANLDASVADYDDAMVSLISQVAQSYLAMRTFQYRLAIARSNIDLQRDSLRIAQAKLDAGDTSELDVDQATTLLENTRAQVPALEISVQQSKNALALLLGESPQTFNVLLSSSPGIPSVKASIAVGMPQNLLRQRPDVRSAERRLAAQSAQIGFAVTDLYPHFSIGGSIGTNADETSDLFGNGGDAWRYFGGFEWDVLNYGRLRSNIRLQDARFQQLLEDYRFTVLQAQVDVENAIVAYIKSHEQVERYQASVAASQQAVKISAAQYENGLLDYNTVITTLNSLRQQQDILATAQGGVTANLVQVYKSLGGGWQLREQRDPVDLLPESIREDMRRRTSQWEGVLN